MKPLTILFAAGLLVVGIGWLAFKNPSGSLPVSGSPHVVTLDVDIKNATVLKSGDHGQLTITASFRQSGHKPVRLEPPLVKLLTADGKTAPSYLGPMLAEPVLSGSGPAEVVLHFWVPLTDLNGPLTLEAAGRKEPVKISAF